MNGSHQRTFLGKRTVVAVMAAALISAGVSWWAYSRIDAPATNGPEAADAVVAPAEDGSVVLSQAQLQAQGIEAVAAVAATQLPVPGLPAQAMAPLEASAQVVAPYAGVVTRILADEGARVREGQPLARIQSREVIAAQGEQSRARSEAAAAGLQARRDASLLAEGIIAAARNEQSQARAAVAQSTLRQADGALARLHPVAGGTAGEYALPAPMAGQVVRRQVAPGQAVTAQDVVFVVAEPGRMDVQFSAPVRLRGTITPGLEVRLPDGVSARVVAVGADADPSSQSLRVRASIEPEQDAGLRYTAGQQFSVSLMLPVPEGALAVPPSALLPAGEGHTLYVMERDAGKEGDAGAVRIRVVAVRLLGGDGTSSVVTVDGSGDEAGKRSPLTAGTRVVSRGTALLKSMLAPK